jgi:hypothetical protein
MPKIKISIDRFGNKKYYLDKDLHREDGPAIEWADGGKEWWVNGKLHRVDGPAVEYSSTSKAWYLAGKRHRIDGPAIEWANGKKEWFLNGEKMTKELWFEKLPEDSKMKALFNESFLNTKK